MVHIKVEVSTAGQRNSKPIRSEVQADGRIKHWMKDGRTYIVPSKAQYTLAYLSNWVGAEEGETYDNNVSLIGLAASPRALETWNHDIDELRSYAFHKIASIIDNENGSCFTGEQACKQFGGQMPDLEH